ncbi:dihydroorotate dehydrogenase electron transfer subunit [Methanocaldococcus infernus]
MIVKVKEVIKESSTVKTIVINKKIKFKPGQFAMLWLPGVDEKPFSFLDEDKFAIAKVGEFTKKMHELKEGDILGVRGPYGSYFKLYGDRVLAIAGGVGSAPILPAVKEFSKKAEITTILGARCKEELLFVEEFEKYSNELILCTDDGSCGFKGYTTEKLRELKLESYDLIITCGPEIMMKKVLELSPIPVQVSMERYMKCGIGICGQCCVDDQGLCVCKDGPVFNSFQLKYIKEFGKYKRDECGRKVRLC